jgi:hypothetical protein
LEGKGNFLQTSGAMRGEIATVCHYFVIARSEATKQSIVIMPRHGLLRGACHRVRIHATCWLAMTVLGGRHVPRDHPEWFLQRFRRRPNTTADETGALDA